MKDSKNQFSAEVAESLHANLGGLNKKHTKKLQKTVVSTAEKLSKTFAKMLGQEAKSKEKKQLKTTKASVQALVLTLHELLGKRYLAQQAKV